MSLDAQRRELGEQHQEVQERMGHLTGREMEVMRCILAGKMNKVIADELNIAMRTVEVHRAHVFAKMGIKSALELAKLLADNDLSL